MNKVRIGIDTTKASPYLVEIWTDKDRIWTERYRFSKKKKAQEAIDTIFKNYNLEKEHDYGKDESN